MYYSPLHLLVSITLLGVSSALDRYPENLRVVKRTGNVTIDCKGSPHMEVTWKMDDVTYNSRQLTLNNVDQPVAGNYTCWQNGSLLDHTYLVISEEDQSPIFQSNEVQCQARTLNGVITCSWKTRSDAFFKVRYCRRNSRAESECTYHYLNYSNSGKEHHLQFTEDNYSPYTEEYRPIAFIVEAVTSVSYQSLQTTFYVGDIVKPDPPQILLNKTISQKRFNISWQYPSSWTKPYSYFPLTFQIDCQPLKKCSSRKCKIMCKESDLPEISIPRCCKARIRAKDKFLNSLWSEWSDWVQSNKLSSMVFQMEAEGEIHDSICTKDKNDTIIKSQGIGQLDREEKWR